MKKNPSKYWLNDPCTISYSIQPSPVAVGWWVMQLFQNGNMIRARHANVTKEEAVSYIKECWQYIRRTPNKREIKTSYFKNNS